MSGSDPRTASAGIAALPSVEDLYRSHARLVHGIALAHVGPTDAEDVMQEVFILVQRGLGSLRDAAAVPGWICQIARHCARDWLRRRARRPRGSDEVEQIANPHPEGDLELASRVLALVRGLPEAYRETLVLRLLEGMTGPEIAARTGLTHGSLRVNLCRGMAMLRPLLEKEGWP